jgi:zinc transport system substrate-binding protein
MREVTDLVKEEDIKIIFFESFVSDKIAQTISKETGASVQSLQPLANVTEDEAKKGYILIMQENLRKLSAAMECE